MASRYGASSTLHQRDPRSALFGDYDQSQNQRPRSGYGLPAGNGNGGSLSPGLGGGGGYGYGHGGSGGAQQEKGYRPATPNSRGQYSDSTLNALESQNDSEISGILGKVQLLKGMTISIGEEIRHSSALAEKMNDGFDNTRVRLRGTMNRMLRMAEKTGVGWKVWVGFFAAVVVLFWWVWLF